MSKILSVDLDWIYEERQCLLINELLLKKFNNAKKIIFIKSHHAFLKYYENESEIYNIDHHHDLGYDTTEPIDEYREGNWMMYFLKNNLLKKYVWVHNLKSVMNQTQLDCLRNIDEYYNTINLDVCNNEEFEKIIICESYDYSNYYSPFMYNILLQICKSIFNDKTIIDDTKNLTSYVRI